MRTTTRLLACGTAAALLVPLAAGNAAATSTTTYTPAYAKAEAYAYGSDGLGRSCTGESHFCASEATADAATGRLAAAFSEDGAYQLDGVPSGFAYFVVAHQQKHPAKSLQVTAVLDLHEATASQTIEPGVGEGGPADAVLGHLSLSVVGPGCDGSGGCSVGGAHRRIIDLQEAGSVVAPTGELVLTADMYLPLGGQTLRAGEYRITVQLSLQRKDQDAIGEEDQAQGRLAATVRSISVG